MRKIAKTIVMKQIILSKGWTQGHWYLTFGTYIVLLMNEINMGL